MPEFPVAVIDDGPMVRAAATLPGCPPGRGARRVHRPEGLPHRAPRSSPGSRRSCP